MNTYPQAVAKAIMLLGIMLVLLSIQIAISNLTEQVKRIADVVAPTGECIQIDRMKFEEM